MPSGGHDAVGRDAVQEQEEEEEETQDAFMSGYTSSGRVQDNRSIGSHSEASSVTSGQKPVYKPGRVHLTTTISQMFDYSNHRGLLIC